MPDTHNAAMAGLAGRTGGQTLVAQLLAQGVDRVTNVHRPDSTVIAVAGDGDFLMTGQECATAVQHEIAVMIVVIDNGMSGTIPMHQERDDPNRVSATRLVNPDFAALAVAFGSHGETVRRTEEFAPAFERARASGKPAVIHCFLDPRARSVGRDMPGDQQP